MAGDTQVIGRAKTALVFRDDNRRAVVSVIIVRSRRPGRRRLRFVGTVEFSKSVQNHIKKVILPIIDRILRHLRLPEKNFEVSAVNLGAASVLDIGVGLSGFSADVAVFVAALSEALQIPASEDFVATGHIASIEGDIRAVKGIPAKVEAAKNDSSVKRFMCPDLEKDESLKVLSPNERDRSIDAIMAAREFIRTSVVNDIGQLARQVFTEENIVLAGLREGYFHAEKKPNGRGGPIQEIVHFLIDDNERRFWDILEYYFFKGHLEKYNALLDCFVRFFLVQQVYPRRFGAGLYQMLRSLPSVARSQIDFPVLDKGLCNKLISFAAEGDYDDTRILLNAVDGKPIEDAWSIDRQSEFTLSDSGCAVFDRILSLINEQALSQKFRAIDSARACFILESLRIQSYEELINTLQAYYIHLQRHTGSSPEVPDMGDARSEIIKLLKRTFYDKGGDKAAFLQARDGTQGGVRSILDMLTEQYKADKQDAYITRVFKDATADMDWEERVACIRAIMNKIGPSLPQELRNQPPERFARSEETIETIIRTYVRCSDKFNQVLGRI
ncbi:MAG: hypothetical protein AMJ75_02235 [Phycisphaerae bacterium SM1_79]|nr:MAG: hypothetical protein AMJ75_02235 [Phycisphaerae bacterium SM1_79]